VETKSGTNQFHGGLYEFVRNDVFNARNFFDLTDSAPPYKKNDFGYDVGGFYLRALPSGDWSRLFPMPSHSWGKLASRYESPALRRLLALDGGGIRGLITLEILAQGLK